MCIRDRYVTLRPRLASVVSRSRGDEKKKRSIRDRAGGSGGGGSGGGRKDGKMVNGGAGAGRSVEEGWEVDSPSDRAVFEERDDAFFADVGRTKDGAFVVINVHSKTTSEVYFLPARNPTLPGTPPEHDDSDVGRTMAASRSCLLYTSPSPRD